MQWQLECAVKKIRDHLVESRISDKVIGSGRVVKQSYLDRPGNHYAVTWSF